MNRKLKISYNESPPHFSVENNQIVKDTVEGAVIQIFIDKNNLTTELSNEQWTWDRKDENGRIHGLIGRVILLLLLSFFFPSFYM